MYPNSNMYQSPYGPPTAGPQYPQYGPPADASQYPQYGPLMGGPQYPPPYPYPGYAPVQSPKQGRKVWLWVLLSVVGAALVICIIASVFAFSAFVPAVSSSVKSEEETVTAVSTQDGSGDNVVHSVDVHVAPIGQAVTIQNVACTVTSLKYSTGDSTVTSQSGDEFAVLHIKLANHSTQTQQYEAVDFYITNSTGTAILNSTLVPKAYAKQLNVGSLAPGQSVEGNLVFEIARSDHGQALNWEPNLNASPDNASLGEWKLG